MLLEDQHLAVADEDDDSDMEFFDAEDMSEGDPLSPRRLSPVASVGEATSGDGATASERSEAGAVAVWPDLVSP